MKKFLFIVLAAALAGCCNTHVCREGRRDVVEVTTSSWRFLGLFALASGNPEKPNRCSSLWFCDSLLLDVNLMMLDDVMRQNDCRAVANVSCYKTKENMLFLFSRHVFHTSAELIH